MQRDNCDVRQYALSIAGSYSICRRLRARIIDI